MLIVMTGFTDTYKPITDEQRAIEIVCIELKFKIRNNNKTIERTGHPRNGCMHK